MQLTWRRARYEAISSFEERAIVKGAGFRWDPAARIWWTTDQARAAQLVNYADDTCRDELAQVAYDAEMSRMAEMDIDIPAPDGLSYMPFQKAGIAYASKRDAVLIADEMGLGKTIQAIGVINLDPTIKKVLIICPASLKINWQRELAKWLTRKMSIGIVNGAGWSNADIVIVNYDILTKWTKEIHSIEWDLMVADEAHYLKNPESQRSEQVLGSSYKKRKKAGAVPTRRAPVGGYRRW
jgi:SWI/SNF-related matrix-associated actin-dependent regulator 1 of chromatin subfamily A